MSGHTPGPWEACNPRGDAWFVKRSWDEHFPIHVPGTGERAEGDAHLIAAAPDMLEALKIAKHAMDNTFIRGGHGDGDLPAFCDTHPAMKKIAAAIAKAETTHPAT